MARGLTDLQRRVLLFVMASTIEEGASPTLRDIGSHLGIRSVRGPEEHVKALVRKGFLARRDSGARAIVVLRDADGARVRLAFVPVEGEEERRG